MSFPQPCARPGTRPWRRHARRLAGSLAVLVLPVASALADPLPCKVNGTAPPAEIALTATAQGPVSFFLICTGAPGSLTTVTLRLTDFVGDEASTHLDLLLPPRYTPAAGRLAVDLSSDPVVELRLEAGGLPTAGKYGAWLVVTDEKHDPLISRLVLTRGTATGALVVSPAATTLQVSRPFLGWDSHGYPRVSVSLREKSDRVRMEGIAIRLEQVLKQPARGFSLVNNADFRFNGQPASDLDVWPARPEVDRSIPAGGQASVEITLKDLVAGEYSAQLGFRATNQAGDDASKLTVTVQVRDSIVWALALLLIAVVISFVATKVVTSLSQRFSFTERINGLRRSWLAVEPQVLPVVGVRAGLKQAEELGRRYWLTGTERINGRITEVAGMLDVLDRVRRMRERLRTSGLPRLPYLRASAELDQLLPRLEPGTLNDAAQAEIDAELKAFEVWLQPANVNDRYWLTVLKAVNALRTELALGVVNDDDTRAIMTKLSEGLKTAVQTKPADLDSTMAIERRYAVLKILWERRNAGERPELVALVRQPADPAAPGTITLRDIDDALLLQVFDLADRKVWERLKDAEQRQTLMINPPVSRDGDPLEAYDPLLFKLTSGDAALDRTFLFLRGLQFQWTFRLDPDRGTKGEPLKPQSTEPRIVQYASAAGALSVMVTVEKYGEKVAFPAVKLRLARSSDFGAFRGLARVEMISWALAAVTALVTGLSIFYFKSPTFGSMQDYLTLFLWGAGVDQGKNFLQALQAYNTAPAKP